MVLVAYYTDHLAVLFIIRIKYNTSIHVLFVLCIVLPCWIEAPFPGANSETREMRVGSARGALVTNYLVSRLSVTILCLAPECGIQGAPHGGGRHSTPPRLASKSTASPARCLMCQRTIAQSTTHPNPSIENSTLPLTSSLTLWTSSSVAHICTWFSCTRSCSAPRYDIGSGRTGGTGSTCSPDKHFQVRGRLA